MALSDDLEHYYSCEEASGNLIDAHGATDMTDNASVGTATGKVSNGRDFELSSSQYFSRSGNPGGGAASGGAFSVQVWMKPESLPSNQQAIGRFDGTKLFQLGMNDSMGVRVGYGISPFDNIQVGATPSTGTWYHAVFTFSATGTGKLYVDGSLVGTDASLTGAFNAATDINIGRRGGDGAEYFDGVLDEIGWWSRELTSDEVTELYNAGAGRDYAYISGGAPAATPRHLALLGVGA